MGIAATITTTAIIYGKIQITERIKIKQLKNIFSYTLHYTEDKCKTTAWA